MIQYHYQYQGIQIGPYGKFRPMCAMRETPDTSYQTHTTVPQVIRPVSQSLLCLWFCLSLPCSTHWETGTEGGAGCCSWWRNCQQGCECSCGVWRSAGESSPGEASTVLSLWSSWSHPGSSKGCWCCLGHTARRRTRTSTDCSASAAPHHRHEQYWKWQAGFLTYSSQQRLQNFVLLDIFCRWSITHILFCCS